jgi:hypothetical protein
MHTRILQLIYIHSEILHVLANSLGVCCEYTLISVLVYLCEIVGTIIVYVSGTFSLCTSKHDLLKLMLKSKSETL